MPYAVFAFQPKTASTFFMSSRSKMVKEKVINFFRSVTVEPVIFFNFLALSIYYVSQHAVIYRTVCIQYYKSEDPHINCDDLKNDPATEDRVQKSASSWAMFLSLCYMIPAVPSDMFLGAWSDRHGRKVSILLGFAGLIFAAFPLILVSGYPQVPIYVLAFSNIFAGLTGYVAIIMISSLAYLTDIVKDKDTLIFRMTLVSVSRSVSEVIGSFLLGRLLKMLRPTIAILVAQIILGLGFVYSFVRIKQMTPKEMRQLTHGDKSQPAADTEKSVPSVNGDSTVNFRGAKYNVSITSPPQAPPPAPEKTTWSKEFVKTCHYVALLYKEVWRTLVKPRENHKRVYMLLTIFMFFCYMMAELGLYTGPVLSLYVFHRPFYWSASTLGTFKGVQHSFALAANLLGALVMKKYLKAKETLVILFALTSGILHLTITGFASSSWMLYLAAGLGCFNTLLIASLKSFLTRQVDDDEVGKALAANGIATDLAYVCTMLIFNNVYRATVTQFSGFVFVLAAVVMAVCFGIALWMHIDMGKQNRLSSNKVHMVEKPADDEKQEPVDCELDAACNDSVVCKRVN